MIAIMRKNNEVMNTDSPTKNKHESEFFGLHTAMQLVEYCIEDLKNEEYNYRNSINKINSLLIKHIITLTQRVSKLEEFIESYMDDLR